MCEWRAAPTLENYATGEERRRQTLSNKRDLNSFKKTLRQTSPPPPPPLNRSFRKTPEKINAR